MNDITDGKVLHKIIEILREEAVWLDKDDPITPESNLHEDLDLDDTYELFISAELDEAFDISMPIDFLAPGITVGELCNMVTAQISEYNILRTVSPDDAKDYRSAIDWLVETFDPEKNSALAQWPERYEIAALAEYATLKKKYPAYLDKATKYLFDAAGVGYDQNEKLISKSEIEAKSIDRRASMIGGFPWTDADNPWPKFEHPDGHTIWAEPVFQLNLAALSEQLGIILPPSLLQFWDGFRLVEIPLTSTMSGDGSQPSEPDWVVPARSEEPAVGWTHSDDQSVGSYIKVGDSSFHLPRMDSFLAGGIAYRDEYVFQSDEDWKDSSEWEEARAVPAEIADKIHDDEGVAYDAFSAMKMRDSAFVGAPTRTEIIYEDWIKDGYRALYSASGSGLSIWGGGFIQVFYRVQDGKFEFSTQVGS